MARRMRAAGLEFTQSLTARSERPAPAWDLMSRTSGSLPRAVAPDRFEQFQYSRPSQMAERLDVPQRNAAQGGPVASDFGNALLAKEMQHRVRGAVRVVLDRFRGGTGEAVVRVEARNLDHPSQPEVPDQPVRWSEEVVVVE